MLAMFSVLVFCLTTVGRKDTDNTVIITVFNPSSAMYPLSVLGELDLSLSGFHLYNGDNDA